MNAKYTPGELAFEKFASEPLVKLAGVDRASFLAGYGTADETLRAENERLRAALQVIADGQVMRGEYSYADTVHAYQRLARATLAGKVTP